MQRSLQKTGIYATMLILAATIAGCGEAGPDRGSVTGRVTFDGDPLADGTIAFYPSGDTKGPPAGGPIKDGSYTLTGDDGPVIGSHKVEIRANRATGETMPAVPPAMGEIEKIEQYIPPTYNEQTTLTAEIQSGENTQDFKLTSE